MRIGRALGVVLIILGGGIASAAPLGISSVQISPDLRTHFAAPADRGVLVNTVEPNGSAARAGLRVGDVLLEVEGTPVESPRDVVESLSDRKKGEVVAILVMRAGKQVSLTTKLDEDVGKRWRSRRIDRPDGFTEWFQLGDETDVRRAYEHMQRRMDDLQRRFSTPIRGRWI